MGKLIAIPAGEPLELRREAGQLQPYLHGEPVHAGQLLELQRADGSWTLGRLEWSAGQPRLRLGHDEALWLFPKMRLRRPRRAA